MTFKLNISEKSGKTYKLELEGKRLVGKVLNDVIKGVDILPDLADYEFEIRGASDGSGFMVHESVEGIGLKKILLGYGRGMKKRPKKEGKTKRSTPKPRGLRLRKTVRGKIISPAITQINLKVLKEGAKKLSEIFPDQNKAPEETKTNSSAETPKEEVKKES